MAEKINMATAERLPVGNAGSTSTGWWGVWTLIITEGSLFGYLLLSYFYLLFQAPLHWPPGGNPTLLMPAINTAVLLTSSVCIEASARCIKRGRMRLSLAPTAAGIVLGAVFIAVQVREWHHKPYGIASNQYGSLYFTITGFHMAHVAVGLVILSFLLLWTYLGYFNENRHTVFSIGGVYWHFVDAVWLVIFSSFYLFPYLA